MRGSVLGNVKATSQSGKPQFATFAVEISVIADRCIRASNIKRRGPIFGPIPVLSYDIQLRRYAKKPIAP